MRKDKYDTDGQDRDKRREAPAGTLFSALVYLGIFTLFALIVFGVFGMSGEWVTKYIFLGVFGFATYGYVIAGLTTGVLKLFKVRRKVSVGMIALYVLTLALIVLMCHLATSRQYVSQGWGEYIKQCYLNANTAGGLLFSLLAYPLMFNNVMYIFSMVVLGLVVGGLAALILVCMLNLDNVVAWRKRSKLGKIAGDDPYYGSVKRGVPDIDADEGRLRNIGQDMYNGTREGKPLEKNFRSSFFNRPTSVKSLDKIAEEEQEVLDRDEVIPPHVEDTVDMYKQLNRQTAGEILYGKRDDDEVIPPPETKANIPPINLDRDTASKLLYNDEYYRTLLGNTGKEEEDKNEEEVQLLPPENKDKEPDIDLYFNGTRKQQLDDNVRRIREEFEASGNSGEADDFLDSAVNSWNSDIVKPSYDKKEDVEDKSDHSPRVFEDFSDIFGSKNVKKADESTADKETDKQPPKNTAFDVKPSVTPRPVPEFKPAPAPAPAPAPSDSQSKDSDEGKFNNIPVFVPYRSRKGYVPPKLELLSDYNESVSDNTDFAAMTAELERTLEDFRVPAKVVNIVKGPAFSRFELQMPRSISVKEVPKLEEDIRACLMVDSIRIEAPIRGKNLVGVEVPNKVRGTVGLKNVINSTEFVKADKHKGLYFALGKDIDNQNYVCNICDFPHALVAGSSGSGKSVFLNCLLCSMLYKYSPQEVRFLLIDPKVVEFKRYEGLPHLLLPYAISDERMAINALEWLVNEMEYRYDLFSRNMVSNLSEYNAASQDKLPQIVLIVDEVGDIMTSPVSKEFEQLIKRLAQKARAAGICMILATQRPSVDVITGTIKANLPTRVAFAVTSYVDSKTILDCVGAEKLLRLGDMLYKEGSKPNMVRLQGAFVSNKEINAVATYVKENNEARFDKNIESYITTLPEENKGGSGAGMALGELADGSMGEDPYFVPALEYFIDTGTVSISKLQRRFSLGFPRAAKLVDKMEACGYIEPPIAGKKDRAVLISKEEFNEKYGDGKKDSE